MTLFFDTKVQFLDEKTVSTVSDWHLNEPVPIYFGFSELPFLTHYYYLQLFLPFQIFALATYTDKGGSITIFNDMGQPLSDISYPVNPVSQSTALKWHPEKVLLVSGWENGEM